MVPSGRLDLDGVVAAGCLDELLIEQLKTAAQQLCMRYRPLWPVEGSRQSIRQHDLNAGCYP